MTFSKITASLFCSLAVLHSLSAADNVKLTKAETAALYKIEQGNQSGVLARLVPGSEPVINGEIHPEEWKGAMEFSGFLQDNTSGLVSERSGYIWIAVDRKYFYMAVKTTAPTTDPGGGLRTMATVHDSDVYNDDSVEVLFFSEKDGKVYQVIANNFGTVFDRSITIPAQTGDVKWNCKDIKVASRADSGWWQLEMRIPLASIGSPMDNIKFNVARTWCFFGNSAMIPTNKNWNVGRMFNLDIVDSGTVPAMQMQEIGMPSVGTWNIRHVLNNLPKEKKYTLYTEIRRKYKCTDGIVRDPVVFTAKESFPRQDGKNYCEYNIRFTDPNQRIMRVLLKDEETGKNVFSRWVNGSRGKSAGAVPGTLSFNLSSCGGAVNYYPAMGKAVVLLSDINLPDIVSAAICTSPGKQWSVLEKKKQGFEGTVKGLSAAGIYKFTVRLTDRNGRNYDFPDAFMLERKKFEWENNKLGCEKIILPPFAPAAFADGVLSVILRDHKLNAMGLWDSLTAQGRELLASPMYYEMVVDGKKVKVTAQTSRPLLKDNGYSAVYTTGLQAGGVRADISTEMIYDGFFWNKMNIHTGGHRLDRMTLVIPMKEAEAKLMHAQVTGIRCHYYDEIPGGKGVVWDGMKLQRPIVLGQSWIIPAVIPYIWLGTESRGLSFALDSTFGMKVAKDRSACRVSRRNGQVVLEIDFINRPAKIDPRETIEFGLQATPVKPFDKKLRRRTHDYTARTTPGMQNVMTVRSGPLGYANNWARNPLNFNYSLYKGVSELLANGGKNYSEVEANYFNWWKTNEAELTRLYQPFNSLDLKPVPFKQWRKGINEHALVLLKRVKEPMIFTRYSDPRLVTLMEPETDYFKTEWTAMPVIYACCLRSFPVRSNLDFMVWCYNQDMIHGQQGIYLDDMFLWPCMNPDTNARYDREGILHNDLGMLELRELVQRLANLQHKYGFAPRLLEIHMSTTLLVPCYSFATTLLGWEWKQGESSFRDRFPVNYIRTMNTSGKLGTEMISLGGIRRTVTPAKEWRTMTKLIRLTRSMFSRTLPHEIRPKVGFLRPLEEFHKPTHYRVLDIFSAFRIWEDDCEFVPYWEDDRAVKGHDFAAGLLLSTYRRKGEVLLLIGNTSDKPYSLKLSANRKALGIAADAVWVEAESGRRIRRNEIEIPADDYRIVYLGSRPEIMDLPSWGKIQEIHGDFMTVRNGRECPVFWEKNWTEKKGIGKVDIISGKDWNTLKVSVGKDTHTPVFCQKTISVKKGDKIKVSVSAAGQGYFNLGIYLLDEKGKYMANSFSRTFRVKPENAEYSWIFEIADNKGKKVSGVRVVLNTRTDSEVSYSQVRAEKRSE